MVIDGEEATSVLVTPVWKDARRLAGFAPELARALATVPGDVRWVIADDGSGNEELEALEVIRQGVRGIFPQVSIHAAERHRGKGGVIREAWAAFPQARWLGFVDADGSVSAADVVSLLGMAERTGRSVIGVRVKTDETEVREGLWRGLRHRGFLAISRLLLALETEDTQCGVKVLAGDDFRRVEPNLCEEGFAFDVELLAELHSAGLSWQEVPVNWVEKDHSRLAPGEWWRMLKALIRIQRRLMNREV